MWHYLEYLIGYIKAVVVGKERVLINHLKKSAILHEASRSSLLIESTNSMIQYKGTYTYAKCRKPF